MVDPSERACPLCAETIKAAAVKCRHCGSAITAPRRPPSVAARVAVVLVLSAVGFGIVMAVVIGNQREADRREAIRDRPVPRPVEVTADQLHRDYHANEVSADERYREKLLRVTGAVQAIRKDFTDTPYIVLWTTNEFQGVHARFADARGLSQLEIGAHVAVRCIGAGMVAGFPALGGCVLE